MEFSTVSNSMPVKFTNMNILYLNKNIDFSLLDRKLLFGLLMALMVIISANLSEEGAVLIICLVFVCCIFCPIAGLCVAVCTESASAHFTLPILSGFGSLSRILILISLFGFFLNYSISRKKIVIINYFRIPYLFLFLCLISVFSANDSNATINAIFQILINVLIYQAVLSLNANDLSILLRQFIITALIFFIYLCIGTYYNSVPYIDSDSVLNFTALNLNHISYSIDEAVNPNQLGIGINQLLPFVVFLCVIYRRSKVILFGAIILLFYLIGTIFLMKSRLTLISSFFTIFVGGFFLKNQQKNIKLNIKKQFFYVVSILLLLSSLIFVYLDWLLTFRLIQRFELKYFTNRLGLLLTVWDNIILKDWLFGVGLGGANEVIALSRYNAVSLTNSSHNMFLSLWAQLGIFGLLTFCILIYRSARSGLVASRNFWIIQPFFWGIVISIVLGMTETLFYSKMLWFFMGCCLAIRKLRCY